MNILITGGSQGIGEASVRLLIQSGHTVSFTYFSNAEKSEKICTETGAKALKLDLTSSESILEVSKYILENEFDVLINNACMAYKLNRLSKIEGEEFKSYLASGVELVHELSKAFVKARKKREGKIINILSAYTVSGVQAQMAPYITLKYALLGLTKCMAKEYQSKNIIVNAISPAMTKTEFLNTTFPEKYLVMASEDHPLKDLATPQEVAEMVSLMVSANRYLHGVNLPVTGGL
jgi:3-oxoacyl-[acyl-carrier protein] reductase